MSPTIPPRVPFAKLSRSSSGVSPKTREEEKDEERAEEGEM